MNETSYRRESGGAGAMRTRQALPSLLAACIITALLWFVPYASVVTYPVRLLVTFLHEGGHALAALLTGGSVEYIQVFSDGSGVTGTRGGWSVAVLSAGYLGATLYGALLIALVRFRGRALLLATGCVVGLLAFLFVRPWANPFGFFWGVGLAAGLVLAGLRLPERAAEWTAAFLGIQCALNALFDLRTLLALSTESGAPTTDAALMSRLIPLPAVVWAVLWIVLAVVLLWGVLRSRLLHRP